MNIYIQCVNVLNISVQRKNKVKHGKAKHKVPKNAKENYARYSLDDNNDIVKNGGFGVKLRKFASLKQTTTLHTQFYVNEALSFVEVLNKVLPQLFAMQGKVMREGNVRKRFTVQFGEINATLGKREAKVCELSSMTLTEQGGKMYLDKKSYLALKSAFYGEHFRPKVTIPTLTK